MEDVHNTQWKYDAMGINAIPQRRQNLSGRVSYGYNNCYFIDANFGYTGSAQFEKGKRFGFFPSIAVQSPNQKIPDRKTKCVIKTHINIKQNVIFGAKLKPV